ncbi:hypothetical protein CL648_01215 [bacterium]|jgi:multicomponent Na+:H+ antiporter subunit D|nr:hypothetical protein [bacterium]|tara:strand:+ start:1938 stop:3446 length:1509 start_codon:yes stop_codon:yes gene_type:complete
MNTLAVIPIIFPLITGIVLTLWRCSSAYRHAYMILSCVVHVLFSTWLVVRTAVEPVIVMAIGGWKAPFGIVLTIDHFAALLIATAGIITLAVSVYTAGESKPPHPLRLPLMHFMLAGVCLSFSTGDFFNLFVAFEIMLMASYALLVLEYRPSDLKYAYSYLLLNIIGSGLFLAAGGLVYRLFGTLNFADISERLLFTMGTDNRVVIISVLMVFVYGLKAGMFPLFYWLPKSYAALPPAIGGLFAGLLTKVGIYALIRILNLLFNNDPLPLLILFVASLFTMIVGILLALTHRSIRMILSFNLIAHIGFMVLGISIFTGTSIMGTVYYMIHHMVVISSLFLIAGIMMNETGSDSIDKMGNLFKQRPLLSVLFGLQALALVGIPPFSGFWGKLIIIASGISMGSFIGIGALIISSVLTLLSMIIIWFRAFYSETDTVLVKHTSSLQYVSVIGLTALSLCLGLGSFYGTNAAMRATDQLQDLGTYQWMVNQAVVKPIGGVTNDAH